MEILADIISTGEVEEMVKSPCWRDEWKKWS